MFVMGAAHNVVTGVSEMGGTTGVSGTGASETGDRTSASGTVATGDLRMAHPAGWCISCTCHLKEWVVHKCLCSRAFLT